MSLPIFDPKSRQVFAVNLDQQNKSMVVVSCQDFERYHGECANRLLGWSVIIPAGSAYERQVRASGRVFIESRVETQIEFRFAAGQDCFGHRVPTAPPRLLHFEGATEAAAIDAKGHAVSSITPIMRRNAKPWEPADYMEKMHEETVKREEALRREGLM